MLSLSNAGSSTRLWTITVTFIILLTSVLAIPLDANHEHTTTNLTTRNVATEDLWVEFTITNHAGSGPVYIRRPKLWWGDWYVHPDPSRPISDWDVQIPYATPNGGEMHIAATGSPWLLSGTEGRFDVFHGYNKVCRVYLVGHGVSALVGQ
ncbi:hypothetical protein B0T20DRAFT_488012 [Sordaria brevicollis]|uniref:Uncharacterized protein n=1 Tax=Sordaria brevicollis TaxID=83679 RepID=A0AAE0U647_SORBR|nr:hypothetical protein B0T20DRAFT_488012 [Sordaria brevicollis]